MSRARCSARFWNDIRRDAQAELKRSALKQGNGVLAHINFSQMFEFEKNEQKQYLGRHIVIATTVDAQRGQPFPHEIKMVVDMHAGSTPLTGHRQHHQSYGTNDTEGAI